MNIEIINTGAELLLGRVLNTHQQWLCQQFADMGREVSRQICVADHGAQIQAAVRESLGRADLVLTTGGLGPTSDDLTRDFIAQLLGRKLIFHEETATRIEHYFAARKRPVPGNSRVQAMVPEGAIVLANANGTAPGLALEVDPNPSRACKSWLVLLPGPPRELRPMFTQWVIPFVQRKFPAKDIYVCRTLKTTGLGESLVEERIVGPLRKLNGLEIGYCAAIGEVEVRLAARGENAEAIVIKAEEIAREALGSLVFGTGSDMLESVIVRLLTERKATLALAESCTGGFIAHRITNVPGASVVFMGGLATYGNEAKQNLLGVRSESLAEHGAVSETVAREMAEGARRRLNADYAIAVTGIAGPGGGSEEKPVGTVFIALASRKKTIAQRQFNPFGRETFKFVTSQQALDLLRRHFLCAVA